MARRLAELPLVREAFGEGRLSFSKVRAITRVATAESEADLLELALHATAAQLERIVRSYRGVVAAQVEHANAAHADRSLTWSWDDDGSLVFRGRLPAEEGAVVLKALEAARDGIRDCAGAEAPEPEDVSAETSAPGRGNADALVAVAEASLASGDAARTGGDRYQVVVHADAAALGGDAGDHGELEDGPALPAETARRLACDASLVRVLERDGKPLSVGRKTRTIPSALRRALRSRDRCCRFPGCTQRRHVDAHHLHHWARGGRTELGNLVLLCRRHHRLLHEGGFTAERRAGGQLRFRRPDGRVVRPPSVPAQGDPRRLSELNRRAGHAPGPETPVALSGGARYSLGGAVERLLAAEGLLSESDSADVSAETPERRRPGALV